MEAGTLTDFSIGFDPVESRVLTIKGEAVREILKVKLWEVSLVTFGAQRAARVANALQDPAFAEAEALAREAEDDLAIKLGQATADAHRLGCCDATPAGGLRRSLRGRPDPRQ